MRNELATQTMERAPSRTLEQITESAILHVQGAGQNLLQLGQDMLDAKAILGHGQWMPWLKQIGQSARTAENLMRLAREIQPGTAMAQLPYTKALAMLALPADEREDFAAENDDKSTREIQRLIAERDQMKRERDACATASEKANARAAKAEKDLYDEQQKPPKEIKVEVMPDDYQALKAISARYEQDLDTALKAVEESERKAEQAEARARQLEIKAGASAPDPVRDAWNGWNDMMMVANTWAYQPQLLARDRARITKLMEEVRRWVLEMQKALSDADWQQAEGAVS